MAKLRVWWIPQVPMKPFYVPVDSPEDGKKIMDILAAYDYFQFDNNIKLDYCNTGGLQQYNEDNKEWEDWLYDDGESFYETSSLDEYCEEKSDKFEELEEFSMYLFSQVIID